MKHTIGYIDTSDKIDHKQLRVNTIFAKLDYIESIVEKMAHEINDIKNELKQWQDGEIKDVYFSEFLNKYIDTLNNRKK